MSLFGGVQLYVRTRPSTAPVAVDDASGFAADAGAWRRWARDIGPELTAGGVRPIPTWRLEPTAVRPARRP